MEQRESPNSLENKGELVNKWIENGEQGALVMYGTSIENLDRIIEQGFIPSFRPERKHHLMNRFEEGNYIYYFLPEIDNLAEEKPGVVNNIRERLERNSIEEVDNALEDMADFSEEFYRKNNAFEHFLNSNGVQYSKEDYGALEIPDDLDNDKFVDIIKKAKQREGVTIFFNESIFNDSEFEDYYEREEELVTVRKKPLGLNSISGIKIYTDEEKKELHEI